MMSNMKKHKGFTLIEMMLVVGIISMLLYMGLGYMQQRTRAAIIDRTAIQMQQILNAGLSYYVNNGQWPADLATLQTDNYLPAAMNGPYGSAYTAAVDVNNAGIFTVTLTLSQTIGNVNAIGRILAGKLPLSNVATDGAGDTIVTASVNIPGQNLANATSVNFAGLYHNGACVPVPDCPLDDTGAPLEANIMVVPVSVSGMSDANSTDVYPLTSINAFAQDAVEVTGGIGVGTGPEPCPTNTSNVGDPYQCYATSQGVDPISGGRYWRVCLAAMTSRGDVNWDATSGIYGTVMAITRCTMNNEDAGSSFDVFAH